VSVVFLREAARLDFDPRRVADDPIEPFALESLDPVGPWVEEVALVDVRSVEVREQEALQVRRVDVVQQRQAQAQLGHAAGVGVPVDAEDVPLEEFPQTRRAHRLSRLEFPVLLDDPAIALDEKRPGPAGRVEHAHAVLEGPQRVQFLEHEIDQGKGGVVRPFRLAARRAAARLRRVQELLVDDRERLDGDEREIE